MIGLKIGTHRKLVEILTKETKSYMEKYSLSAFELDRYGWVTIWKNVLEELKNTHKWLPYNEQKLKIAIDDFIDLWDIEFEEDEGPCELISAKEIKAERGNILEIDLNHTCRKISKELNNAYPGDEYMWAVEKFIGNERTDEYALVFRDNLIKLLEDKGYNATYNIRRETHKGYSCDVEFLIVGVPL